MPNKSLYKNNRENSVRRVLSLNVGQSLSSPAFVEIRTEYIQLRETHFGTSGHNSKVIVEKEKEEEETWNEHMFRIMLECNVFPGE